MATTVASGTLYLKHSTMIAGFGQINYSFYDSGYFSYSFTAGAGTWKSGMYLEVTYNGTTKKLDSWTRSTTFTYKRSVSEITFNFIDSTYGDNSVGCFYPYSYQYGPYAPYTVSWTPPNTAPSVSFSSLPTLYAGKTAKISWTSSDPEGDSVSYQNLYRYYKASGATQYSYNILTYNTTSKSYTDTIPDIVGGSVYYKITAKDAYGLTASATSSTVTVQKYNNAPTASISVSPSTLYNGKTATITWSFSDADGDTVNTTKLVRYYKAAGASSYSSTTLTTSNVKTYTDTIPSNLAGGSVYYIVTFTDGTATATKQSSTYTVQQSCNVNVIVSGVITQASDVAVISNGVITTMNGELHPVVSGVIT